MTSAERSSYLYNLRAQISIGSRLAPIELAAVAILFAEDVSSSAKKSCEFHY